ncbi:MAG TPA: DUF1003 domain-containing protein [Caulobacteraceae bacterium]|nr:DUF1003 domain-containing protein [Caulobacteraceae bacterium]
MAHPTWQGPKGEGAESLAGVLHRNIQALEEHAREQARRASLQQRIAQAVTDFAGSMTFVYLHLVLVGGWAAVNLGLVPGVGRFDPTFVILATVASVEAIFLSTFVLISQNRAAEAADRRAQLDLQINLLAEHEITRLISLTKAVAEKLGVEEGRNPELPELERDVAPEAVLQELAEEGEE